jgi:uncharacterized protein
LILLNKERIVQTIRVSQDYRNHRLQSRVMAQPLGIPQPMISQYLAEQNPWWTAASGADPDMAAWPRRAYFSTFVQLVRQRDVNRAVVVLGQRRVGKTVMLKQAVQSLLADGVPGTHILYAQLDLPMFSGESLDSLLRLFVGIHKHPAGALLWVMFDEIQYLAQWESHLKVLVDQHRNVRFVATGSAAAALRLKSRESGAGRFTDFILPPLTFAEYLDFADQSHLVQSVATASSDEPQYTAPDIAALNHEFINYLNYGGFPEAVMSPTVRQDPSRFLRADIVDKVLQKDLPSLFGIANTQELNRFFNLLAFNTGNELSPKNLCAATGLDHQRLGDYLEYLEAAYLIKRVHRIDDNARRMQRATTFKVYLTNPSLRTALFGRLRDDDPAMGHMAETAIWSQWLHSASFIQTLHYARWKEGRSDLEVDLVGLNPGTQKPAFAVEIKWSDKAYSDWAELRGLRLLASRHALARPAVVTTKTALGRVDMGGVAVHFVPSALHCYTVARNLLILGEP